MGCTRNKKHEGDLEKDGLKWEKMRAGVSGAMGWLRAGRQSEVGDDLWVVMRSVEECWVVLHVAGVDREGGGTVF